MLQHSVPARTLSVWEITTIKTKTLGRERQRSTYIYIYIDIQGDQNKILGSLLRISGAVLRNAEFRMTPHEPKPKAINLKPN